MATTKTVTVKPSGGNYPTLADAIAGEAAINPSLIVADTILVIECYAMTDTSPVSVTGITTDATRYIKITVPTSERHTGKISSNKYRIIVNAADGALSIYSDYVRIDGLQVSNSNAGGANILISSAEVSDVRFTDTISYGATNSAFWGSGFICNPTSATFNNCIASGNSGPGWYFYGYASSPPRVYNCVSVANTGAGFEQASFRESFLTNCYAGSNVAGDYLANAESGINMTTCHSADTSGNTQTAYSTSSGAYFASITLGSEDLHIGVLSGLRGVGTNLNGDTYWIDPGGLVDIDGNPRSVAGAWSVGVDEYVSGGVSLRENSIVSRSKVVLCD